MGSGSVGPYLTPPRPKRQVADTLACLRGTWYLDRRLTDHRLGVTGSFTGQAEFAPAGDPRLLRYREHGELRLDLPFVSKGDVALKKIGLELVVRVDGHRRTIVLPGALAGFRPTSAKLAGGSLVVGFEGG